MALNEAVRSTPDLFDPAPRIGTVAPDGRSTAPAGGQLLDPGFHLTLRPMRYPQFYEMYLRRDPQHLDRRGDRLLRRPRRPPAQAASRRAAPDQPPGRVLRHRRLDRVEQPVLNLYQHINTPEARMYLSRQLYEEALHVQFYLTLLDTYIPDQDERAQAILRRSTTSRRSAAGERPASVDRLDPRPGRAAHPQERKQFLLNLICFAARIEGLFFLGAFAYVYFLRPRACSTGWRRHQLGVPRRVLPRTSPSR